MQWRINGRGSGGPTPPPSFSTKIRPEGPKKIFLASAPPPPYFRLWLTAAPPPPLTTPYLKVWIRYCNGKHRMRLGKAQWKSKSVLRSISAALAINL